MKLDALEVATMPSVLAPPAEAPPTGVPLAEAPPASKRGYPAPAYAWYVVAVLTVAYVSSFIDRQILACWWCRSAVTSGSAIRR